MKISFFQYLPIFNNISSNIDDIKKLLDNNKNKIAASELLVLPEYAFSGPLDLKSFTSYKEQLKNIDIKKELTSISQNFPNTYIIFGSLLLPDKDNFHNSSLVYYDGKEIGSYSKKALIYNENFICQSDNKYLKFTIGDIRIGVAICWDLILPEIFRHYVGEVDLVVVPSFWGIGGNALQAQYNFSLEKKYYRELCLARAYENAFGLLFVNSVGKYKSSFYSDRLMGGSLSVVPPLGETYFTNSKDPNELHVVDFDFNSLNQFREFYATDKDYIYYKTKKIF